MPKNTKCEIHNVPYVLPSLFFFVSQWLSWKSLEAEKNSFVRIMSFGKKLTSVEDFEKMAGKITLLAK